MNLYKFCLAIFLPVVFSSIYAQDIELQTLDNESGINAPVISMPQSNLEAMPKAATIPQPLKSQDAVPSVMLKQPANNTIILPKQNNVPSLVPQVSTPIQANMPAPTLEIGGRIDKPQATGIGGKINNVPAMAIGGAKQSLSKIKQNIDLSNNIPDSKQSDENVTGVPFSHGKCPAKDKWSCNRPTLDLSLSTTSVKPGEHIIGNVRLVGANSAKIIVYDSLKYSPVTAWVWHNYGAPKKIYELKSKSFPIYSNSVVELVAENPHGIEKQKVKVSLFKTDQKPSISATADGVNRDGTTSFPDSGIDTGVLPQPKPRLLVFKASPNPVAKGSSTNISIAFIGGDEVFLLQDGQTVFTKSGLNPNELQEFKVRQMHATYDGQSYQLTVYRNSGSNNPNNASKTVKGIHVRTARGAEIINFKATHKGTVMRSGDSVTLDMAFRGASHAFLEMKGDGAGRWTNIPLTKLPKPPLKLDRDYWDKRSFTLADDTQFRLRISNPHSGQPTTKTINVAVNPAITHLSINKSRIIPGEKIRVSATIWGLPHTIRLSQNTLGFSLPLSDVIFDRSKLQQQLDFDITPRWQAKSKSNQKYALTMTLAESGNIKSATEFDSKQVPLEIITPVENYRFTGTFKYENINAVIIKGFDVLCSLDGVNFQSGANFLHLDSYSEVSSSSGTINFQLEGAHLQTAQEKHPSHYNCSFSSSSRDNNSTSQVSESAPIPYKAASGSILEAKGKTPKAVNGLSKINVQLYWRSVSR